MAVDAHSLSRHPQELATAPTGLLPPRRRTSKPPLSLRSAPLRRGRRPGPAPTPRPPPLPPPSPAGGLARVLPAPWTLTAGPNPRPPPSKLPLPLSRARPSCLRPQARHPGRAGAWDPAGAARRGGPCVPAHRSRRSLPSRPRAAARRPPRARARASHTLRLPALGPEPPAYCRASSKGRLTAHLGLEEAGASPSSSPGRPSLQCVLFSLSRATWASPGAAGLLPPWPGGGWGAGWAPAGQAPSWLFLGLPSAVPCAQARARASAARRRFP
ncbi:serine/arginine repetitive matrix protein 1-like [Trichosurus vulpecula]|uniref:serine/arginine repetitive matrix protein 1-like n=1 Tax=Trichosurus vulpecula TaxID=9337 RepID=UPI00186B3A44|nr:serine/arginine repetitive matrix protein 1-like [Trichosurus vulpecula]